ncbi:hypothetical protein [Streptomyces sp. NPDC051569]|uniref:hypothetical protein n=1 Tax=Streptomyces sp. NPDC051569 TaxID=3365661 RepID=UPI0037B4C329
MSISLGQDVRPGVRTAEPPGSAGGVVMGWGPADDLVLGYAHALGRPVRTFVDRASALDALTDAAERYSSVFLLAPESDLDFGTVDRVMETGRSSRVPIGLLPLPEDAAEAAFLVDRSRRLAAPAPRHRHRTALYCDFASGPPAALPGAYGSGQADAFMARLTEGVEALVLHSHGNGADFRVGNHVLCLRVGPRAPKPGRDKEHFLPCQAGGTCRLDHKTGFVAYHGASAVRARLVVMLSCSAYQPHGGLLQARFQFSQHLLRADHAAAVVASIRINHGTPQLGVAVTRVLEDGATVGEVALRINQLAPEGAASYVCLGDPDLALPPPPVRTGRRSAVPAGPPVPGDTPAAPEESGGERAPRAAKPERAPGRAWQAGVDLLFAADLAAGHGAATTASALATAAAGSLRAGGSTRFDHLIARMLARTTAVDHGAPGWQSLCSLTSRRPGAPCPLCGRTTVEEEHTALLYSGYRRLVARCPEHAVVRDLPAPPPGPLPGDLHFDTLSRTVRWDGTGLPGVCAIVPGGALPRPVWRTAAAGRCTVPATRTDHLTFVHVAAGSFSAFRVAPAVRRTAHA